MSLTFKVSPVKGYYIVKVFALCYPSIAAIQFDFDTPGLTNIEFVTKSVVKLSDRFLFCHLMKKNIFKIRTCSYC